MYWSFLPKDFEKFFKKFKSCEKVVKNLERVLKKFSKVPKVLKNFIKLNFQ